MGFSKRAEAGSGSAAGLNFAILTRALKNSGLSYDESVDMKTALAVCLTLILPCAHAAETMSGQPMDLRPPGSIPKAETAAPRTGARPDPIGQIIDATAPGASNGTSSGTSPRERDKFMVRGPVPKPLTPAAAAAKDLTVVVTSRRLVMRSQGQVLLDIPVSLGRPGHQTVRGCYEPFSWDKNHHSSLYPPPNGGAPMLNSVFFYPAQALHAGDPGALSHGCVHIASNQSAAVYKKIVKDFGIENTSICIN